MCCPLYGPLGVAASSFHQLATRLSSSETAEMEAVVDCRVVWIGWLCPVRSGSSGLLVPLESELGVGTWKSKMWDCMRDKKYGRVKSVISSIFFLDNNIVFLLYKMTDSMRYFRCTPFPKLLKLRKTNRCEDTRMYYYLFILVIFLPHAGTWSHFGQM